jgi:hypothetical protein
MGGEIEIKKIKIIKEMKIIIWKLVFYNYKNNVYVLNCSTIWHKKSTLAGAKVLRFVWCFQIKILCLRVMRKIFIECFGFVFDV